MTEHVLKCDTEHFVHVVMGEKPFEIRKNDRGFKEADVVLLQETKYTGQEMMAGAPLEYTGRAIHGTILAGITDAPGLQPGYVVLPIEWHIEDLHMPQQVRAVKRLRGLLNTVGYFVS